MRVSSSIEAPDATSGTHSLRDRADRISVRARAHPVRGQGRAHLWKYQLHQPISSPPETRTRARWREVEMNLEQLRKQAKELVRRARSGDPEALERMGGREPILASAQLVLAREHGYPSWPALVATLEASVEAFVTAVTEG